MRRLFKQFSFPGGIPSHAAPETPGSINEGGELGYSLAHAFGAAFDNPDLIVACVVGDGEAETGPLAASWHCNKFLNPADDGAVLPILHLNGYKIANPTMLARIPDEELLRLLRGYGWRAPRGRRRRPGDRPPDDGGDARHDRGRDRRIQQRGPPDGERRTTRVADDRAARRPKGWTGPKVVDGHRPRDRGGPTRCPSPRSNQPRPSAPAGGVAAAATGPRSCSTTTARLVAGAGGAGP